MLTLSGSHIYNHMYQQVCIKLNGKQQNKNISTLTNVKNTK